MSTLLHHRKLPSRALALIGPLCMMFAGLGIANAGAATAAPSAVAIAAPHTSQFCTFAESAAKTNAATAASGTPKSLTAAFAKLKSEEPVILAASPSQIKSDFQVLFNFFNKFYGQLASVKYNYLKLPRTYLMSLAASEVSVTKASKAIETYLVKTCGLSAK